MRYNYAPWPHLDVGGLPERVREFLLWTIVASLYTGLVVIMIVAGLAVTNVMSVLIDHGVSEFSNLATALATYLRDATIPA